MANYNADEAYINSLKASFCRQFFPSLKQFLEYFDISERIEDKYKYYHNSLGMHFLLDFYNEKKDKDGLKAECHWAIKDVTDEKLYQAIEEFFYITKDYTKDNSSGNQRNSLLEKLLKLGLLDNEQSPIADTILKKIATYFGIIGSVKALGNMYQTIDSALKQIKGHEDLYAFRNALKLFSSVRNSIHDGYCFQGAHLNLYHQFVIFTYIGYVYVCRRIWEIIKENDIIVDFTLPEEADNFHVTPEVIEISVVQNKHEIKKIRCIQEDQELEPVNDNPTAFMVQKYQPFILLVEYDEEEFKFEDILDYYSWQKCYKIILPNEWTSKFKDNEKFSHGMNEMIDRVVKSVKECANKEIKMAISQELATLDPVMQQIREGFISVNEYKEPVAKVLEDLCSLKDDTNQAKDQICHIHNQVKDLHERFLDSLNDFSDNLYDMKKKSEIVREGIERVKKNVNKIYIIVTSLLWALVVIIPGFILYKSITNDISFNILWLKYKYIYLVVAVLFCGLPFLLMSDSWKCHDIIRDIKNFKNSSKRKYYITGIVALILGSPFLFSYQLKESLIEEYEFLGQDSIRNQRVAQYLEDNLSSNEEAIRSKLALYYADIVGNLKRAEYFSSPLLNVEKYKDGSLVAMYVLYCQKEIPTLASFIERYGDFYGKDDPAYCDLMGALLVDTLYGYRDIEEGKKLLWKACEAGSMNAYYNLGFLYSSDVSTYEAKDQGGKVQESKYNLPLAIDLLKIASDDLPRASILLGDIYADLQMTDSATFYYEKAITETKEGVLYRLGKYKMAILFNKLGVKPNDFLLDAQLMKFPPALMFSSIKMDIDTSLIKSVAFSKYFYFLFRKRDHKQAIKWYEDAIKNRDGGSLEDMGVYQYIPPVVYDYIYIGEKGKALSLLQETRSKAQFDDAFVNAVELLIGSANVKPDNQKGMQLMHESAQKGCLYSKLFCLYKDTEKELMKTPTAYIDTTLFNNLSKEISFAHVMEALLFIRAGKLKLAEDAAHMAMWKKHPAGAFAFEFMPPEYYIDFENNIKNKANGLSNADLFKKLRIQEMALRSTWSNKDNSLVLTCVLDKVLHDRLGQDFTNNFKFWTEVAIENECIISQVRLLRIYEYMINNGYKDTNRIIDPLLKCVLFNFNFGKYDLYPNYNEYIILFIKFLRSKKLFPQRYLNYMMGSYWSDKLAYYLETVNKPLDQLESHYRFIGLSFVDDYSLFTEFASFVGPYSFRMGHDGNIVTLKLNMNDLDYYNYYLNN